MSKSLEEQDINQMSPLIWAYVGDAIFELKVREYLIETTNFKPHKLHIETTKYVRAQSQAKILEYLKENQKLNDEELEIVRRGRNAQNYHNPKNASIAQYSASTALEGLFGYLYLNKKEIRLHELIDLAIKYIDENKE